MEQDAGQLTYEDARYAHEIAMIESGDTPALVIDRGKLEGALMRPAMAVYYEDASLAEQVARLVDGVATAHGFQDGNKRTAAQLGDMYLRLRGMAIAAPSSDDTTLGRHIEMLVSEDYPEYSIDKFTAWLEQNIVEWTLDLSAYPDIDWDFPEGDDADDDERPDHSYRPGVGSCDAGAGGRWAEAPAGGGSRRHQARRRGLTNARFSSLSRYKLHHVPLLHANHGHLL